LVKEVEQGNLSRKLKLLKPGLSVLVDIPRGFFTVHPDMALDKQLILVATGTGIAPFHSFIRSFTQMSYKIIHGVKYGFEAYDAMDYEAAQYTLCTTRDNTGTYYGRVNEYLASLEPQYNALYYLCGNYEMIDAVQSLLIKKGIVPAHIKTEGYF
jgi:ferredoxin-NADP reductase